MRVTIRYFAAARERAGISSETLELDEPATAAEALAAACARHPALQPVAQRLRLAVDQEFAAPERKLRDGSEVALIPPVSGGAFRVTEQPLSLAAVVDEVTDESAGAVATFLGTVRRESRGRTVLYLEYEAYAEMAEDVMAQIAAELEQSYDLWAVAIHHRVGRVEIGEASVAIAVSAPHRHDALAACKDAIDTLKQTVPLWKKEVYEGGEEWLGRAGLVTWPKRACPRARHGGTSKPPERLQSSCLLAEAWTGQTANLVPGMGTRPVGTRGRDPGLSSRF